MIQIANKISNNKKMTIFQKEMNNSKILIIDILIILSGKPNHMILMISLMI